MARLFIMFFGVYIGTSSLGYGVILDKEQREDLENLQTHGTRIKQVAEKINVQIRTDYNESPKVWIHHSGTGTPEQIAALSQTPQDPWPDNIFPQSVGWEKSPNMLQYGLDTAVKFTMGEFWQSMPAFMKALGKRASTGEGLVCDNQEQVEIYRGQLNALGKTFYSLLPSLEVVIKIYAKYSDSFSGTYLNLMKPENISKADESIKNKFIRDKLFLDAAQSVCAPALNAWGNLGWLYARKYQEMGDDSLMTKLPKHFMIGSTTN